MNGVLMSFFANLGNWIWDGIILNTLIGGLAALVLALLWGVFYGVLRFLAENQVYQGLFSSDDDNPLAVAVLCLSTPPLFVGMLGFLFGLIWASLSNIFIFLWNIFPFTGWGESDGLAHLENLSVIYQFPLTIYETLYYMLLAEPIVAFLVIIVSTLACFGLLAPQSENGRSLSNSNSQYAALSISIFLSVFSIFLLASFSSLAEGLYQSEVEQHVEDMPTRTQEENSWYPNYTVQSSEGYEYSNTTFDSTNYAVAMVNTEFGFTGYLNESTQGGFLSCLSLNSLSDQVDAFRLGTTNNAEDDFHVRIQSTELMTVNVLSRSRGYPTQYTFQSQTTDLDLEFHTSSFSSLIPSSHEYIGFTLTLASDEEEDSMQVVRYNVAYVFTGNEGVSNQSNASLDNYSEQAGHPTDCDQYAINGALEPRVRLTFVGYVFSGMFLSGCVLNRYFVILGHNGTTDLGVLFKTFISSQMASMAMYGFLVFIFDPLDGMGITGLRMEIIVATTIFASKVGIIMVLLAIGLIGSIALYRQRDNIGEAAKAVYDHDREISEIERDWFGG